MECYSGNIDPKTGQKMLLGSISLDALKEDPFQEWYASGFQGYDDYQLISAIEDPNVYTYEVFLVHGAKTAGKKYQDC